MLNSLLVLAGAVVGLAGGVFASIYGQYRQSKREKYQELRANLLAVTREVSKILAEAEKYGIYCVSCPQEELAVSDPQNHPTQIVAAPIMKIQAIVSLYFPEILDHADALEHAWVEHESAAYELLQMRVKLKFGKISKEDVHGQIEKVGSAGGVLAEMQKKFEEATRELMSKLLKEKS